MIVVCVAGVWGILHAGSRLTTAPDLTGQWLTPTGTAVAIEQSGRFVRLRTGADPAAVSLDIVGDVGDVPVLTARGPGGDHQIRRDPAAGRLTITGPTINLDLRRPAPPATKPHAAP
jgi:hypothetical protein